MIGLKFAQVSGGYAAPIWLPSGIAVAAVILGGKKYLPAIWLGAFVTHFFIGQAISYGNLGLSAAIATGNMLEALTAELLLRRVFKFHSSFGKLTDATGFVSAALLSTSVSAIIGALAVSISRGRTDFQAGVSSCMSWWIGDALGALILSPILISLAQKGERQAPSVKRSPGRSMQIGRFASLTALILLSFLVFGGALPVQMRPLFSGFLMYSIVVWSALVLPIRRFFYAFGIVAAIMFVRAYMGVGLFGSGDVSQRLALVQFFLGCISVTMMILNTVVSERVAALEESHERELALMQANKMSALGEMSSGIAHEISNPLLVIYGKTEIALRLVESGKSTPDAILPILEKIDSMARRIDKVIKAIRFYSRKGDVDPFKVVSVRAILDNTLELCKDYYQNQEVELVVEPLAEGVSEELTAECRPVLIGQVFLNLLINAQTAAKNEKEKWVRVATRNSGSGFIEISVTDSGPGIPEHIRTQMFKPFFTTKRAGEGTGLGLSLSRNIVESHGGTLTLDTDHAHTRFVVRLPMRQPAS
jgi:signal transduction histidine kinase